MEDLSVSIKEMVSAEKSAKRLKGKVHRLMHNLRWWRSIMASKKASEDCIEHSHGKIDEILDELEYLGEGAWVCA